MMELLQALELYLWWNLKTHWFPDCINTSRNGDAMGMTLLLILKINILIMS